MPMGGRTLYKSSTDNQIHQWTNKGSLPASYKVLRILIVRTIVIVFLSNQAQRLNIIEKCSFFDKTRGESDYWQNSLTESLFYLF